VKEPTLYSDQSIKMKKSDTYKISGFYDRDDSSCLLGYDTVQSGKCYLHCEGTYCFHIQGRRSSFFHQNVGTHLTCSMLISEDHSTNAVLKLYSD